MADIHILPTQAGEGNVDHITELLRAAFADGVDFGPRGHHIDALVLSLEANLAKLQAIADELGDSLIRDSLPLEIVQAEIAALGACVAKLIAMTKAYRP